MRRRNEIEMGQNCAEEMLMKAVQLVMGKKIQFRYKNTVADEQIDIAPAFLYSPDEQRQVWHSGNKEKSFLADLKRLNTAKVYFLRNGTNGGAGHWQVLYFSQLENGWMNYSTNRNNYQLTRGNHLTNEGKGILTPCARWGFAEGQYSFLLVEATRQNIIHAANFLYDVRTHGEEKAVENSANPKQDFYEQIKQETKKPIVQPLRIPSVSRMEKDIGRNNLSQRSEVQESSTNSSFLLNTLSAIAVAGGLALCIAALVTAIVASSVTLSASLLVGGLILGTLGAGTFFYRHYTQNTENKPSASNFDALDFQR